MKRRIYGYLVYTPGKATPPQFVPLRVVRQSMEMTAVEEAVSVPVEHVVATALGRGESG